MDFLNIEHGNQLPTVGPFSIQLLRQHADIEVMLSTLRSRAAHIHQLTKNGPVPLELVGRPVREGVRSIFRQGGQVRPESRPAGK